MLSEGGGAAAALEGGSEVGGDHLGRPIGITVTPGGDHQGAPVGGRRGEGKARDGIGLQVLGRLVCEQLARWIEAVASIYWI